MTADAFDTPPTRAKRGPACSVGLLVATVDTDGPLRRLAEILELDSGWTPGQIAERLVEHGITGAATVPTTIARHRRRYIPGVTHCDCP